MADLQFGDFALTPGRVRKENHFGLPDDFSNINVTVVSRTDSCSVIRKMVLHNEGEARNFNIGISANLWFF